MTAIRFTYSGNNYDFTDAEIDEMKYYQGVEKADIFFDIFGNAECYLVGRNYKMFEITFNISSRTCFNNLQTIASAVAAWSPDALLLYYEYGLNPLSACWVQMRRDQYVENYHNGRVRRGDNITIQFYETYVLPGMLLNPKVTLL